MQFFADLLNMKTQIVLTVNCAHILADTIFRIYLQRLDPMLLTKKINTALVLLKDEEYGIAALSPRLLCQ